jgi:hypothetical protein
VLVGPAWTRWTPQARRTDWCRRAGSASLDWALLQAACSSGAGPTALDQAATGKAVGEQKDDVSVGADASMPLRR